MNIKVGDAIWVRTNALLWRRAVVTAFEPGTPSSPIICFDFIEGNQDGKRYLNPRNIRPVSPLVLLAEIAE